MSVIKQGVIIGFLGKTQDRFSEYQEPKTTDEKLELVSQIDGFTGVEMVFPYENDGPVETKALMDKYGLEFAAINVNVKKEAEWVPGALSRPDKGVRDRAVAMIKKAKDFAKAVGAPHVTCCPLSDGYDVLFQIDYKTAWNYMVETIGEAADYLPEIPLFIEPKYSETRVHCQLDTTAKTLLLLKDVQCKNTGITIDMGHSLQSQENPAQALSLIYENGFDAYIHTNDNDTKADWDLVGASRHFLNYIEMMFWAQQYNYNKHFTTDASPRIFDMVDFFNRHSEVTIGAYKLAKSLNHQEILEMMKTEDYNGLMKMVNKNIYRI
ncbi:MAG: sugar phosphate isomerase/epimerase [Labilibaculum sp.]|nr:sugar phosphate isomerase/epimerase family protein [Labilibaculum sp.]MBI9057345.1 sugar phosphate isomerase/epimerase [Labilibaculum sp.]